MGVAGALGEVRATAGTVSGIVRPVVAPVFLALVWLLNEIASTFSVYIFGTCIGLLLGGLLVAGSRGSLASADAAALATAKAKSAAAAAKSGTADAKPVPLPIPQDVLAEALRHLPRWTKEPDVDRASWLNNLLDALWPHVDTSVSQVIKDSLEPVLRTSVPPLVSWIGFEKVTLGPTPPCVGGVKVMGSSSEDVMLELEVVLATGLDIVLTAYVFGVRIPIRVHDLQLRANLRVTFTPLVAKLPCLGGLEVSLMSLPEHADFGLTVPPGIDLMSLPGMHSVLRFVLWKFVSPMLVYPAKMTIPIMDNGGVEKPSSGMIKVTNISGAGFSERGKLRGSGMSAGSGSRDSFSKKKSGVSFPQIPILTSSRYIVQLNTRVSRKISLTSKSADQPTWDETHHFLTNNDSTFTAVVLSGNLKELGRCEIPLRRLVAQAGHHGNAFTTLHIPLGDPDLYLTPIPAPRDVSPGASPRVLADIAEEHELALEKHALELSTLRVNALDCALRPPASHTDGVPVLTCTIEYKPLGAVDVADDSQKGELATKEASQASARKAIDPVAKIDSDSEEDNVAEKVKSGPDVKSPTGVDPPSERRGILTVFVTRGVRVLRDNELKLPNPVATVRCAGQSYTTEALVEKTKSPVWDEEFLFFNVVEGDTMTLSVNHKTATGEFLGGFDLRVAEVAANKEVSDMFQLQGVTNAASVFVKARFAYMS